MPSVVTQIGHARKPAMPAVEDIRAYVRPVVTISLVWAFVGACLANNFEAAKLISVPMSAALAWWFADRMMNRADG